MLSAATVGPAPIGAGPSASRGEARGFPVGPAPTPRPGPRADARAPGTKKTAPGGAAILAAIPRVNPRVNHPVGGEGGSVGPAHRPTLPTARAWPGGAWWYRSRGDRSTASLFMRATVQAT